MAKKIELLHTTYDESGNIESQEVVHPLTSPDCIIMENGKTLDEVMGDGIATPTLTHEGTSFKVGVGDSNIEVVDGDVAGMTLKGQSYQNILPKPTTLIMETDEQEFKINDKIDSNIIIDDNIAEIATVKGKTIVNTVQEESASEYTVLGEDLSGQSIVTTNKPEGNIKGVTLQGQTLVNTIQEPCEDDYVVLGADDGIEISAETGGHGTIEDTIGGSIKSAILKGNTLVNSWKKHNTFSPGNFTFHDDGFMELNNPVLYFDHIQTDSSLLKPNTKYLLIIEAKNNTIPVETYFHPDPRTVFSGAERTVLFAPKENGVRKAILTSNSDFSTTTNDLRWGVYISFAQANMSENERGTVSVRQMLIEYQEGMENWDIPYFEGMKSVQMPVLTTVGANLLNTDDLIEGVYWSNTNTHSTHENSLLSEQYIRVRATETLYLGHQNVQVLEYDINKTFIQRVNKSSYSYTVPNNVCYIRLSFYNGGLDKNIMISRDNKTTYEPYKSNILTTNEEVELRGIDEVKDELDLITGELTQRVGEIVLNGSEGWSDWSGTQNLENISTFQLKNVVLNSSSAIVNSVADKFVTYRNASVLNTILDEGLALNSSHIFIRIAKTKLSTDDVDGFKTWLSNNNIAIQYELETPVVKTIDLTVTDQDDNTIPHIQAQPTVTHINASSDYLIPTVTIDNNLAYDTIIKPSTLYTVRFKHDTVNADNPLTVDLGGTTQEVTSTEFTITTPSELTHNQLVFSGKNNVVSEVQVIESDVTNIEYPFFEGMNDVKSPKMVITGKNLFPDFHKTFTSTTQYRIDQLPNGFKATTLVEATALGIYNNLIIDNLEPNTIYTIGAKITISDSRSSNRLRVYDIDTQKSMCYVNAKGEQNYQRFIVPNSGKIGIGYYFISNALPSGATTHPIEPIGLQITYEDITLVKGDNSMLYESYHEPITVQQDVDSIPLPSDMFEQGGINAGNVTVTNGMSYQQFPQEETTSTNKIKSKTIIPVKPNAKYKISFQGYAIMFDKNGDYVKIGSQPTLDFTSGVVFTIPSNVYYIALCMKNSDGTTISPSALDSMNLILQEVPQEIVLRGIGDVKDELDLTRGEYIQRIGEIVFVGDPYVEFWKENDYVVPSDNTLVSYVIQNPMTQFISPNFSKQNNFQTEGLSTATPGGARHLILTIKKDKIQSGLSSYLRKNPITIQYVLATPIIHKVNLTNTKVIPSYATETHYETITPSDSLIPNITIPSTLNYDVAIKPSTEYTIRANTSDNLTVDLGGATGALSNGKVTLTTPATLTHNEVSFSGTGKVKELMVVEGSEIKDNVPFFNGMKDVQMGGIKLVNIARGATTSTLVTTNGNKTQFTYKNTQEVDTGHVLFDRTLLKPNTVYTIYCNITSNTINRQCKIQVGNGTDNFINIPIGYTGIIKETLTTTDYISDAMLIYFRSSPTLGQVVIQNPMIIEGDWTHLDEIPYVESEMIIEQPIIRSQGKNLLDLESKYFNPSNVTYTKSGTTYTVVGNTENYNYGQFAWTTADLWFRKLLGKEVTLSVSSISCTNANSKACIQVRMECTDGSKVYRTIFANEDANSVTFTIPSNAIDMALQLMSNNTGSPLDSESTLTVSNIQLEWGDTATPYEPYRHQTLYSNRVIGYEENCYHDYRDGSKYANTTTHSVLADVDGLSIAYATNISSNITFWDKDGMFISGKAYLDTSLNMGDKNGFVTVPTNAKYMRFASYNLPNNVNTHYTKATVTGDLPLRSLPNGVCDTLNLVTGEYMQRVGEVVLDGSEIWGLNNTNSKTTCYYLTKNSNPQLLSNMKFNTKSMLCNRYTTQETQQSEMHLSNNEGIFALSSYHAIYINSNIMSTSGTNDFKQYLSQNPITVQYELVTPIVRKLGFTTKGNYREQVLDGSETWAMDAIDNTKTVRMTKKTTSPLQNPLYNTVLFTDDYHVRASGENHSTYEYITCIGNGIYINIYQSKVKELSVQGCTQWLSQNPIKVGYITSTQSSESYSNIHKPIFFNNVDVQYLPNNVDIQPELTYQVRTRNSYVLDMMKANTKYSVKLLLNTGEFVPTIDGVNNPLVNGRTFTSPSTLTNKLLITPCIKELMIIEGDVTGKNLPYFKGILSSYHDVDEIELYSVTNNIFDGEMEIGSLNNDTGDIYDVTENCIRSKNFIKVHPNTPYYINCSNSEYLFATYHYDENYKYMGVSTTISSGQNIVTRGSYIKIRTSAALVQNDLTAEIWITETQGASNTPHAHSTTLIEMPTRLETVKVVRPELTEGALEITNGAECASTIECRSNFIPVQPSEFITVRNGSVDRSAHIDFYDIDKNFISYSGVVNATYVPDNCYFIRFFMNKANTSDLTITRQTWKPIQLNSLPNGVCDEIIMKPNSNKAQLVQRVGKVILCGNLTKGADTRYRPYSFILLEDVLKKSTNKYTTNIYATVPTKVVGNTSIIDDNGGQCIVNNVSYDFGVREIVYFPYSTMTTHEEIQRYTQQNPITVYYELATPITHEIQLKGYPHVYENGTVTLNTDTPHKTLVSYNVNQEQLINTQNETIIRHDQQIDDLYYYIEMYLEEIYQMELFRMKLELSL